MKALDTSRSVLFADISDSTGIYEALGDAPARALVRECLELMKQVVVSGGGTVVDEIGDEVLATFPDAATAGRTSCALHRAIATAEVHAPARPRIRIGFHHGPVVIDEGGVFGDTVHVAKRVVSLAKPQQTLTTGRVRDLIGPEEQLVMRFVDRAQLKGKVGSFKLFEVVWDVGAATATATGVVPRTSGLSPDPELVLHAGTATYTVDSAHPVLTIGRDPRADVFVDHARVSRLHARLEYRKGDFVFVDASTNGSQVVETGEAPRGLRRGECPLAREGTILLGLEGSKFKPPALRYAIARKS